MKRKIVEDIIKEIEEILPEMIDRSVFKDGKCLTESLVADIKRKFLTKKIYR